MKKVKSIFMKPTILLGIAAVLLLGSGVGSARAALTYFSDQYSDIWICLHLEFFLRRIDRLLVQSRMII